MPRTLEGDMHSFQGKITELLGHCWKMFMRHFILHCWRRIILHIVARRKKRDVLNTGFWQRFLWMRDCSMYCRLIIIWNSWENILLLSPIFSAVGTPLLHHRAKTYNKMFCLESFLVLSILSGCWRYCYIWLKSPMKWFVYHYLSLYSVLTRDYKLTGIEAAECFSSYWLSCLI